MHRTHTSLYLLLISATSMAQPVIDLDNVPTSGDIVPIGICSDPIDSVALNASAGAMQVWDFSTLTEQTQEQFEFVDPAGSLWANDFPGSTLCGISWDGSHAYYSVSPSALEQDGACSILPGPPPEDTAKIIFGGSSEVLMELPLAFGDAHADAFSGTFDAGPFLGSTNGTIDFEADGYGTLVLPNGTYSNVLRYRFDRVQNNTVQGITTTTTKVQWGWVSEDHRYWLLLMEINDNGFNPVELVWYSKVPPLAGGTGLSEQEEVALLAAPNPVPASGHFQVNGLSAHPGAHGRLLDATGRLVRSFSQLQLPLSTEGLEGGGYLLQVVDGNGVALGAIRLFVQ